jgi:hypothetical protein
MHKTFFLILLGFLGCGIREAERSARSPKARSVVEAFLTTDTTYSTRPPFLLLKTPRASDDTRYLHGAILSISDSGVVFRRSKEGTHTSPKPEFYPYSRITCLVDSNNHIAFGQWSDDPEVVWDVELICQRLGIPNVKPAALILHANESSSYYLDPGEYRILYIRFTYSDEYIHQTDTLPNTRFRVSNDAITYIGSFYSEYKWHVSPAATIIPGTVLRDKGMGAAGAVFGGVIGYLADRQILDRAISNSPYHALTITDDPTYVPVFRGSLPLIHQPIQLDEQAP